MPYWQLYYHIVTTTKERKASITPEIEPVLYGFLRSKVYNLEGTLYAVNGMPDHVHLVVSIPPKIAVATFIGQVKGVAAALLNRSRLGGEPFHWQEEYGVYSFDHKRLPGCIAYVEQQKIHHAQGTTSAALERCESANQRIGESAGAYLVDDWPE